jgi:hypothetical protein
MEVRVIAVNLDKTCATMGREQLDGDVGCVVSEMRLGKLPEWKDTSM